MSEPVEEKPLRVFFVAGEASGDSHAASVARELKKLEPDIQIEALGGPKLAAVGAQLTEDFIEHAAMGLLPVLAKLPTFVRIMRETRDYLIQNPPDVVVPVDYPGFNLRLSRMMKAAGIPVCFYVSPQVWAWRPGRIHKIGRSVDHMMVLFDFELELYKKIGTPVTHVGHPLFDSLSAERSKGNLRREIGLKDHEAMVGLLPGSRRQEIRLILPELLLAAQCIYEKRQDVRFVIPVAKASLKHLVDEAIAELGDKGLPLTVIDGRAHEVMKRSRVALTASGTATLELGFYQTPMVIVYKINALSKLVVPLLGLGLIGLVNIIAGRELVREFLDSKDRSKDIAEEALKLLRNGRRRKEVLSGLRRVRQQVGAKGTATRAAQCILEVAREHRKKKQNAS
jgi:lipid-A-disaccharide synthase